MIAIPRSQGLLAETALPVFGVIQYRLGLKLDDHLRLQSDMARDEVAHAAFGQESLQAIPSTYEAGPTVGVI